MHIIEARDGTHLYSKCWGEGRPVVLIHGWPLSGDSWDPVTHALADAGFKAIAYDRRGFGRSTQPSEGYDYDTFADDLGAVLDHYDAKNDVALVGFSMGGGEIARYLSRHGAQGVSKVALIGSIVPYLLQTDDNPDGVPQSTFDSMTEGMLDDRATFFTSFFKDFFGIGAFSIPVSEEMRHVAWNAAMQAGLRPTLAAAKAFASTDFRGELGAFTMPTLVIHGTADKIVPIDPTARAFAKAVPHARLVEYDGEPHGLFATQTQRLIDDLLTFLSDDPERSVFADLDRAEPEARQDIIDEITAGSIATHRM